MQKGKIFVFAGAVAAVFGGAYADDNAATLLLKKTVASKAYVDDAFQPKIRFSMTEEYGYEAPNTLWGPGGEDGELQPHRLVDDIVNALTNNAQAIPLDSSMFGGNITEWNSERDGDLGTAVPSINFVGQAVETRQSKIPAGTLGNVVTYTGTEGSVGSVAVLSSLNNYNSTNDSGKLVNAAAVVEYVGAHSPTIPAPTGDCLNTANHCALVTTYANGAISYSWTVMAK